MAMQGQPPSPPPIPPKPPTPPASAGVTTSLTSCAQPTLLQMNVMTPFIQNFDKNLLFVRSLKVFVMSYIGFDQLNLQMYQQKLVEYVQAMGTLYDVQQVNPQMMQTVNNWLAAEIYHIVFDAAEFTHRPGIQSAKIRFAHQIFGAIDINLDPAVGRQNQKQMVFQLTSAQLRDFRVNNVVITITLELILTGQQQPINAGTFDFEFGRVHPEGFYDWIRFGNEEQVLLNFVIQCRSEQGFTPDWVANYHMHSVLFAVSCRLVRWRASNNQPLHQLATHGLPGILYRNYIDPNSLEVYWPEHPPGTTLNFQRARFMDLQMGLRTTDYFPYSGCMCNEWCNWMAFFNFNPIYRFLLVRHSQTYLHFKANKPEMYMYSVAIFLFPLRQNLANNVATLNTPLLRLMSNAIDFKERFYSELFLKDLRFRQVYPNSHPRPHILSGAVYLILRTATPLFDLCYQSDTQPFGLICVDNFIQYCLNIAKLHDSITPYYVHAFHAREWRKERDEMHRNIYSQFLPFCVIYTFGERIIGTDTLFDTRSFSSSSENLLTNKYVRQCREQAVRIGSDPLNSPFRCQPAINALVGCNRLIRRFEESIGKPESKQSIQSTCDCYIDVDRHLTQQIQLIFCDFYVDQLWLTNQNIQNLAIPLTVCYTLKLYAIIHNLQRYFTNIMFAKDSEFDGLKDFELIFDKQLVEQTVSSNHSIELFTFNDSVSTAITAFYDQYWGQANHMRTANPDNNLCIQSALFEHQRTYFWWRNGGDQRFRFMQILTTFQNTMNEVVREADTIFQDYILSTILSVQSTFDYTAEVLDYLVYYLVKAICYTIFRTAREMHKKLHELEVATLVASHRMYALSRPGYTPIFRTLRTALATVEAVGQKYAIFDDETVRIADAITQTKALLRSLYQKHYFAIVKQFYQEICDIYQLPHHNMTVPYRSTLAVVHLANGFGFLTAMIDDCRSTYRYFYKLLMFTVLNRNIPVPANMLWRTLLQNCRPIIDQFLNSPDAIQMGQPLLHPLWQNNLQSVITHFDTGTEQTLNINLAAADI